MKQYLDLLAYVRHAGARKHSRTGVETYEIFGDQYRVDLQKGFPLLTTKKMPFGLIVTELLWFLQGRTHAAWLQERGCHIWDEWATQEQCARFGRETGDLGPIYGHQWRNFGGEPVEFGKSATGVDQISQVIQQIRKDPDSRRLIVSAWDPLTAGSVALPPCHTLFQFSVSGGVLSCQLYQRSADLFLGVPFNLASYALLTHMVAAVCDLEPGFFIHTFGSAHIYHNHIPQVDVQLERVAMPLPSLILNPKIKDIFAFGPDDIGLKNYQSHSKLSGEVAV